MPLNADCSAHRTSCCTAAVQLIHEDQVSDTDSQADKAMLTCCHPPALQPQWLHTELLGSCYVKGGKAVTFYTFLTLEAAAHGAELLPSVPQLWAVSQPE